VSPIAKQPKLSEAATSIKAPASSSVSITQSTLLGTTTIVKRKLDNRGDSDEAERQQQQQQQQALHTSAVQEVDEEILEEYDPIYPNDYEAYCRERDAFRARQAEEARMRMEMEEMEMEMEHNDDRYHSDASDYDSDEYDRDRDRRRDRRDRDRDRDRDRARDDDYDDRDRGSSSKRYRWTQLDSSRVDLSHECIGWQTKSKSKSKPRA